MLVYSHFDSSTYIVCQAFKSSASALGFVAVRIKDLFTQEKQNARSKTPQIAQSISDVNTLYAKWDKHDLKSAISISKNIIDIWEEYATMSGKPSIHHSLSDVKVV